eukprot:CAMPEP_0174726520 /NCGR_PEP_ID=MMETSP1094-20130205/47974_1 /TAXON_ID=156173 /ORGANISM="Chrysochromulina brevifilum, Strain UTEX LB 985" /LENGTH=188 /DNA_ID=CAMNT_0015928117 /DNA_START=377 /DNA_END=943 /DNA_ORIENTATION=-
MLFALFFLATHSATAQPAPPANNTYCMACEAVAKVVILHGCEIAKDTCTTLPAPASTICQWIATSDICPYVANFTAPYTACKNLGLCGTECECGVCKFRGLKPCRGTTCDRGCLQPTPPLRVIPVAGTKSIAGPNGRCLGAPNSCGHTTVETILGRDSVSHNRVGHLDVCLDGQCNQPESVGCCLTCF